MPDESSSECTSADSNEGAWRDTLAEVRVEEIPETLQWLQGAEQDELTRELNFRLVRKWAESDARAAALWTVQLPAGSVRDGAIEHVAIVWANQECEAAAQWARELPAPEKQHALGAIAQEILRTSPIQALQLSTELSSGDARDRLIPHAVAEWAITDANAAIAWARQIPDQTLREQSLASAAVSWSESNPVAASRVVSTCLPAGRLQADAEIGIVQRWAQQDRRQAALWVASFSDDELRQIASETLVHAAQPPL